MLGEMLGYRAFDAICYVFMWDGAYGDTGPFTPSSTDRPPSICIGRTDWDFASIGSKMNIPFGLSKVFP